MHGAPGLQWAEVAPGLVVVATPERAWIYRPAAGGVGDPFGDPFVGPLDPEAPASPRTTGLLLHGAMAAARRQRPVVHHPPASARRWVFWLASQYHASHPSSALLLEASQRFAAEGRHTLAEHALCKSREESGHDQLALRDLQALGHPAEALVAQVRPAAALELVEHFASCVRGPEPVTVFGHAYALERSAELVSSDFVRHVESLMPPGVKATRCLRVHSALGADAAHTAELLELIATLPAADRVRVARAVHQTTLLLQAPPPDHGLDDAAVERCLAALPGA
jgi:hypothetical protein